MRARIAVFLSAIVATAATSQTVDVTECLSIDDQAARKACFSALYENARAADNQGTTPEPIPTVAETPVSLPAGWSKASTTDEMRGTRSFYVLSPDVPPSRQMTFPYQGTTANLVVACNADREWAYLVFSKHPNIVGDTPRGAYSEARLDIAWGSEITRHLITQDVGSKFLMFSDSEDVFRRIETSPRMIVEIPWYSQGRVQFSVSLTHGKQAVAYLRQQCR